jgi:hypothetical protein
MSAENRNRFRAGLTLLITLSLAGCILPPIPPTPETPQVETSVPVEVQSVPGRGETACDNSFHRHTLIHETTAPEWTVAGFDANGSGIAAGDLDRDGRLDLVLGGYAQPNTILWNDGNLSFEPQQLGEGLTREVQLVDVDGDGRLDIATTRRGSGLAVWRNTGADDRAAMFEHVMLAGIDRPLYSMDWLDVDADGDLDLGAATYDAELKDLFGSEFLMNNSGGAYLFSQENGRFRLQRLTLQAQGLATLFLDVTGDGKAELLVGNDFATPDFFFQQETDGWHTIEPFDVTTHSTMSLSAGDINNDGRFDLFATDMKPAPDDQGALAAWQPVMEAMMAAEMEEHDERQLMQNVLQVAADDHGGWADAAHAGPLAATGWSWAGSFGDLDNDGWLDLYVVNGMIEATLFAHLPDHELVERNHAFRSGADGSLMPAPEWNLGDRASGRGMVMADLDRDGDLDIAVNNLRSPAALFENRLCGGVGLQLDLRQATGGNSHAVGAQAVVATDSNRWVRTVHVADSYLSGRAPRLHFGLGNQDQDVQVAIEWPDGQYTTIGGVVPGSLVTVIRE